MFERESLCTCARNRDASLLDNDAANLQTSHSCREEKGG